MENKVTADVAAWIANLIKNFVSQSKDNTLGDSSDEKSFDSPLIGFSNGADPLYEEYVSHIGSFYQTPIDIFRKAFPKESAVSPNELTVISWVLPSTKLTRQAQAVSMKKPSEHWVRVRHYGELFNESLRRHVARQLTDKGIHAVAPMLASFWKRSNEGPYAPCSNWSERHAAYAAGLGTFGLCDGLITSVGKAMRTGSVIAAVPIQPSERLYSDHHAYCLFYSHGTCGKCISRCPVNAISKSGHDKKKCMQYTEVTMNQYVLKEFGISTSACGLCQAGVPCTDHIPIPEEG